MTNNLLVDENEARIFCREYLLPSQKPRVLQCVARKKYAEKGEMATGSLFLERVVRNFDNGKHSEDDFIRQLRKFEILVHAGVYTDPKNGETIQLEWIAVYITAFPLDEEEAADAFVAKLLHTRKEQRSCSSSELEKVPRMKHLVSLMQSLMHQHPCRKFRWLKLDVDTKDAQHIKELQDSMKGAIIQFASETRGGYHVVFEKGPCCRGLYEFAERINKGVPSDQQWLTIENNIGPMLAIPGTRQGGFVVNTMTEWWREGVRQEEKP